jgi:hypothetical protein
MGKNMTTNNATPQFKSLVASESFVYLVPVEGKPVTFSGNDLLTMEEVLTMVGNINTHGSTPLICSNEGLNLLYEQWLSKNQTTLNISGLEDHIKADIENESDGLFRLIQRLAKTNNSPELNQTIVDFISKTDMPVTVDGNILGYRRVVTTPAGIRDGHSRTVPNEPHTSVSMCREMVDSNGNVSCSPGLHVGTAEYVKSYYGDVLHLVLVHPEDIVSVPYTDRSKLRTSKYTILYQYTDDQLSGFLQSGSTYVARTNEYFIGGKIPKLVGTVEITKDGIQTKDKTVPQKEAATHTSIKRTVISKKDKAVPLDIKAIQASAGFSKLLALFEKANTYIGKKSRFNDLLLFKKKRKQSWEKLGANPNQIKELKGWEIDGK